MAGPHTDILNWIEQGRLPPGSLSQALRLANITPGSNDWRRFLEQTMLWLGTIFCAAAVIFFFAYNWQGMARYAKFGLVEALIVLSLLLCWRLDLNRMTGKAALLMATMLVGALLALVGQTYQTGADTWKLFFAWSLAVFPWIVLARFGALWLVWLGLLNLSVTLYFQTFGGLFGMLFSTEKKLWTLFALNTAAFCVWEFAAQRGIAWLRERWPLRILATAGGGLVTTLALWAIFDFRANAASTALTYVAWLAIVYVVYRHRIGDVFILAGEVLSVIVVVTAFLSKHMLKHSDAGAFLVIGMVVIGLSAVGGMWLKTIAKELRA